MVVADSYVAVATLSLVAGQTVVVHAPPGGSTDMAITMKGAAAVKVRSSSKGPAESGSPSPAATQFEFNVITSDPGFADSRVFRIGAVDVEGDELMFTGRRSSTPVGSPVITVTGSSFSLQQCSSGSCSSASGAMHVIGISPGGLDQISVDIPATVAISNSTPVVSVPVVFDRADATPVRGISATIRFSNNLIVGPIPELDYLSSHGQTQKFDVVNPDGSHTVDIALLGPGCGPTTSGQLFSLPLQRAPGAPDGLAFVSIDAVEVADCSGGPVPASPGGKAFIMLDGSPPPPVSALTATQVKSGNAASGELLLGGVGVTGDASGRTALRLAFPNPFHKSTTRETEVAVRMGGHGRLPPPVHPH